MASHYYASAGYDYQHHQQQQDAYHQHQHYYASASSSHTAYNDDDYASYQPAEHEPEAEHNMAGFGARRMAETSRRKAEEEARRMREWERQQQQHYQYEEEQRIARLRWEEEQEWEQRQEQQRRDQWEEDQREEERRRWYAQQQQHYQEDEERRCYEQQESQHQQHQQKHQQHQYDQSGYGQHEPRYRQDSNEAAYAEDSQDEHAAVARWYQQDFAPSAWSSKDSQPAAAAASQNSTYSQDDSGYAHEAPPSSDDNGAIFKGSHLALPAASSSPRGSLAGIRSSILDRRATIYDDEFEEAEEDDHVDITANLSRYTHYGGPADDANNNSTSGDAVWSGARKSLFRNTTYQPLPKARCADCLEELDFDELADHACDQASSPATPLFGLPPTATTPGSEATTPLTDVSPSSTSFFDKYAARYEQARPIAAEAQEVGAMVRSSSEGDNAHGGLGLGLGGVATLPARSNSSPTRGSSPQDESIQDRRRRIEAQREAKRQGGSSPSPSFTASSPTKGFPTLVEPSSPTKQTPTKARPQQRGHSPSRNASSSSSGSSGSYSSTNSASSSAFQGPVSVSITPSSSFGQDSRTDDQCGPSSRDLLSPEMASGAFRKELGSNSSKKATGHHHHHQRSASAVAVEAARKLRLEQLAASASAANKSPRLPRKEVDLGNIEDLMETLQVNSSTDKKTTRTTSKTSRPIEPAAAAPGAKPLRRANRPPQLTLSAVARHDGRDHTSRPSPTTAASSSRKPHRKCCVCQCSLSNKTRTAFVEKDGQYFCASDYRDLYLPKCSKCTHPVERDAVKSSDGALRGIFHRGCFCCFECDAPFAQGVFYVWKDRPYCLDHYSKRAGTQCVSCHRGIEGVCRQTVGDAGAKELFHPACLRCEMDDCRQVLEDFFVVGGKRLCERHAEVVQSIVDEAVAAKVGANNNKMAKKKRAEKRRTMLRALS